jgi:glycogen operon protein
LHSMPPALGAIVNSGGVNFAIYSAHATGVELCLFDSHDAHAPQRTIALTDRTGDLWHINVPGIRTGQAYGYRVHGPWDPANGQRFNPSKLLLDPYARALARAPQWHPSLLAYAPGSDGDGAAETTDSAPFAPLGAVADLSFEWGTIGCRTRRGPTPSSTRHRSRARRFNIRGSRRGGRTSA